MDHKILRVVTVLTIFLFWCSLFLLMWIIFKASNGLTQAFIDTEYGRSFSFLQQLRTLSTLTFVNFVISPISLLFNFKQISHKLLSRKLVWITIVITALYLSLCLKYWFKYYSSLSTWINAELNYQTAEINLSGTGSMYPTFPKGKSTTLKELAQENVAVTRMLPYPNGIVLFGVRYFGHQLTRGDIVVFENDKTRKLTHELYEKETGFAKRVIGLPNEILEIRDGLVYINNSIFPEPYIARARSTFGGNFLSDCKKLLIPDHKIFVMGDNRKSSLDSRFDLELVDFNDISYVLPLTLQKGILDSKWRSTVLDQAEFSKINIDKKRYLSLVNLKRQEQNISPLTYEIKLEKSAQKRGEIILKNDDFSFEATKSGYTMEKALLDNNYQNIIWAEISIPGYYEAEELFGNLFEQNSWQKYILNPDYQDFGLAEFETTINGCPTQIIVQHFGGYVPPNYASDIVENWQKTLTILRDVQSGWLKLTNIHPFYKDNRPDIDRINEIISTRIVRISEIVAKMQANEWLTKDQVIYTKEDLKLSQEQNELANKLNSL